MSTLPAPPPRPLFIPSQPILPPRKPILRPPNITTVPKPTTRHQRRIPTQTLTPTPTPTPTHPLFTNPSYRTHFLKSSWGKRPVLFRALFPSLTSPITPNELAYLATTPDASTRLITGTEPGPYTLHLGPLPDQLLTNLPPHNWTLLLDQANIHIPALSTLLTPFSFLPNHRVGDVMVSYAPTGGSVGPHVDNFDVFLVQGAGRRRWRTGHGKISAEEERERLADGEVRVLRDGFVAEEDWVLEKGDALYVPPRVAHHGVSLDEECMTFSVGFRKLDLGRVVCGWAEEVVRREGLGEVFVEDLVEELVEGGLDSGRVGGKEVGRMFEKVLERLGRGKGGGERFGRWYAKEVGGVGGGMEVEIEEGEARRLVDFGLEGVVVRQMEGAVFTYFEGVEGVEVFVNGEAWQVDNVDVARMVCAGRCVEGDVFADRARRDTSFRMLLIALFRRGLLYVDD